MLATLVGLSMLLTLVGGTATLAGCLLSRRLRARQARRHPEQAVTAALDQLPVAVVGLVRPAAAAMPAGRAGRAVGAVVPHQPATPSTTGGDGVG